MKQEIKDFLQTELHLELSEENALITHVNDALYGFKHPSQYSDVIVTPKSNFKASPEKPLSGLSGSQSTR